MSFFFVCWHSRKWWPPIRGGTLQMLVLWPEKLNQIDSFCKSLILYAWGGPRSIERCKKHGAPPKKTVFPRPICHFLSLSWKVAATNQDKMILAWKVAATDQAKMIWVPILLARVPIWSPFHWKLGPHRVPILKKWVPMACGHSACTQGLSLLRYPIFSSFNGIILSHSDLSLKYFTLPN